MSRLPILKLALASLALTIVISAVMLPINWHGAQASTAAADIDRLLDVMIVLSAAVFAIVVVALTYALMRFRVKPGDESDGEPIHGNTRLEITWTVIPTLIVLFIAGYSWVVLEDIEARDSDRMVVNVFAQQYDWNFTYPDEDRHSSNELHVPAGTQVEFKLHSFDVIHSFWVPEWRIKKDSVPGIVTRAIVTPDKEGTYQLICTELCGWGHSTMRATVVVEPEEEYQSWLSEQSEIPDAYTQQAALARDPDYD